MIMIRLIKKNGGKFDLQDSLSTLPGTPWAKYPNEKHFPGYQYLGPSTRLDIRLDQNDNPRPGEEPISPTDYLAYKHDLAYRDADSRPNGTSSLSPKGKAALEAKGAPIGKAAELTTSAPKQYESKAEIALNQRGISDATAQRLLAAGKPAAGKQSSNTTIGNGFFLIE